MNNIQKLQVATDALISVKKINDEHYNSLELDGAVDPIIAILAAPSTEQPGLGASSERSLDYLMAAVQTFGEEWAGQGNSFGRRAEALSTKARIHRMLESDAMRLVAATKERDDLRAQLARRTHERGMLATAIADAAIKAGIARPDAAMTGPLLIMLAGDLAECAQLARPADLAGLTRYDMVDWKEDGTMMCEEADGDYLLFADVQAMLASATAPSTDERAKYDAWAADNLPQYFGLVAPTWEQVELNVRAETWAAWQAARGGA